MAKPENTDNMSDTAIVRETHYLREMYTGKTDFEFEIGKLLVTEHVLDRKEKTQKLLRRGAKAFTEVLAALCGTASLATAFVIGEMFPKRKKMPTTKLLRLAANYSLLIRTPFIQLSASSLRLTGLKLLLDSWRRLRRSADSQPCIARNDGVFNS